MIGLTAALAVPLTYTLAAWRRWRLPLALLTGVAVYFASDEHSEITADCRPDAALFIACVAIATVAAGIRRIPISEEGPTDGESPGPAAWNAMAVRTLIPAVYVMFLGLVQYLADPRWTGLVSTFPACRWSSSRSLISRREGLKRVVSPGSCRLET